MALASNASVYRWPRGVTLAAVAARAGISEEIAATHLSTLLVLSLRVAGAAAAYGAQVLTARFLGAGEYGVFALLWVWIAILGQLAPLGFNQAVSRFVPRYLALGEFGLVRGFLAAGLMIVGAAALVSLVLGAAFLLAVSHLEPRLWLAIALAILVVPLFSFQDFLENTARAFNWLGLAFVPSYLVRHSLTGAAILTAMLLGATADAATALMATLLAILLATLLQATLLLFRLRPRLQSSRPEWRFREWIRCALPLVFVDGSHILFMSCDVLILCLFVSPAEVAVYFAATRLVQIASFIPYAATAATSQRYSALGALKQFDGLKELVHHNLLFTLGLSVASAGVLLWASPWLLLLFGTEFTAGVPLVAVMLVGIVAQIVAGPAEDLLNMLGHERSCAAIFAASVPLLLLLLLLLVPVLGLLGAAMATALATLLRAIALAWLVRTRLDIHILSFRALGATP